MPERLVWIHLRVIVEKVEDRGDENANNGSPRSQEQGVPRFYCGWSLRHPWLTSRLSTAWRWLRALFHTEDYANYATSVAIWHINALTILKVVKAEAHLHEVAAPV